MNQPLMRDLEGAKDPGMREKLNRPWTRETPNMNVM